MKKNYIVVTGGAGFIGSNLINYLIINTKYKILSIDNYSSGSRFNHIKSNRVTYFKTDTKKIFLTLKSYKKKINSIFHFGEFARIYQSFKNMNECIESNMVGTYEVINFCFINKIKLIYSATSASIGNNGNDKNLSPYAFSKAKNLEFLNNLKSWFNFRCEIIYFYNVYGPNQIRSGNMATVIGIFEDQYKRNKPLTIVKPGTQTRRFTHVEDTIKACFFAWRQNKNRHYSISSKKSYSIIDVAKMFDYKKIKFLPKRPGERFASALTNMNLSNKVHKIFGKKTLKSYIKQFIKNN